MLNTLVQLFTSFMIIGFTSFGGMSMVPLINEQMINHGWMTQTQVADIIAIAEMTPGPLGINCATFAGYRTAGLLGSIVAVFGVLIPSLTLAFAAAIFFEKFKNSRGIKRAMTGVRPATTGMIIGIAITLITTNYLDGGAISYTSIAISLVDLLLLMKLKWSVPIVIGINAAVGVVLFGVLDLV